MTRTTPTLRPFSLLLVGLALCAVSCHVVRTTSGEEPRQRLRVMTWNIHHGRGLDGVVDLDRIADVIRKQDIDIVALQEVDRGTKRTDGLDMPRELGKRLGADWRFGKNIDFQGGDYGNAILSRWPIASSSNIHYRMLREGEQRGVLKVAILEGDALFEVWATHLDYRPDPAERLLNVEQLRAELDATRAPVLLMGDFNATPDSPTHRALTEAFDDAWDGAETGAAEDDAGATYPAAAPTKRIDWIVTSSRHGLRPLRRWVVPTDASDHCGVVAEFDWPLR